MRTKNIKFIILTLAVVHLTTSCKKDLLNTPPNDRLSSEVFWRSENDAKLAVNAIYPFLDSTNIISWDGLTDIGHTNQFFTNDALVERGVYDATNPKIAGEWNYAYKGIAAANYFLDNVDKVQTTNTALINQLKGEARTLRAYQYIKLASFFGDVPLVTKTINIEEGRNLTRTPVAQIWDFVDKELSEAAAALPVSYAATEKGRVTKGAALALQARANLFAGRYQQAADAAKKVMDLNVYSIYPQYAKLFTYAAENNAEVILDKEYIKDVYPTNIFAFLAPYSQKGSGTANWVVPTKKLVDLYPMSNGKDIADPSSGFDPANPYTNRDPRLRFSIFLPGDILPDGKTFNPLPNSGTPDAIGSTFYATSTGFTIKKYINNEDYANINNSGINIILLRYAEVLLTYAEAKIELNQIDQSVYDAINKVRQRSDVNLPPLTGLSQSQLQDAVRKERTIELAFEGLRLFDIRRWKIAETVIPGPVQGITYNAGGQLTTVQVQAFEKVFNSTRDYLWPIPQKEKELNSKLTQNTGW
ncbi:MAG: RagB/SusD family nutrient uptake outer membrane protein [Flavisolibacter sp.]|nr:RagB/SusD family nutrient uptake outer membrane protein [Flavisolibacter sp.]